MFDRTCTKTWLNRNKTTSTTSNSSTGIDCVQRNGQKNGLDAIVVVNISDQLSHTQHPNVDGGSRLVLVVERVVAKKSRKVIIPSVKDPKPHRCSESLGQILVYWRHMRDLEIPILRIDRSSMTVSTATTDRADCLLNNTSPNGRPQSCKRTPGLMSCNQITRLSRYSQAL